MIEEAGRLYSSFSVLEGPTAMDEQRTGRVW